MLAGCEAPLDLDRVEQEKARAIHRFDNFKGLARSSQVIVAASDAGTLLRRKLSGSEWERVELPTQASFVNLADCPNGTLLAVDSLGVLWIGDVQGEHWMQHALPAEDPMMGLACSPEGDIWVSGGFSTVLHSSDGGENWTSTTQDEDLFLPAMQYLDDDILLAAGEFGTVMRSADKGTTWERMAPIPDDFYPLAFHFRNVREGWVGGLNGRIWHTTDGGQSWQAENTRTDRPIYQFVADGQILYALGDNGTVLQRQEAAWSSLTHVASDITTYLIAGIPQDDHHLLVAGGGGLLRDLEVISPSQKEGGK
ncbi:YCF48-related protein [Thiolapillus brandeum]|nr:YCF48-related protein [Thiolapillus brandeum]